jgi:hypothetical protein
VHHRPKQWSNYEDKMQVARILWSRPTGPLREGNHGALMVADGKDAVPLLWPNYAPICSRSTSCFCHRGRRINGESKRRVTMLSHAVPTCHQYPPLGILLRAGHSAELPSTTDSSSAINRHSVPNSLNKKDRTHKATQRKWKLYTRLVPERQIQNCVEELLLCELFRSRFDDVTMGQSSIVPIANMTRVRLLPDIGHLTRFSNMLCCKKRHAHS